MVVRRPIRHFWPVKEHHLAVVSAHAGCTTRVLCANPNYGCNCDANDNVRREDSGLLTDKTKLPVKELFFGDNGKLDGQGYHTLGKFKCYGTA